MNQVVRDHLLKRLDKDWMRKRFGYTVYATRIVLPSGSEDQFGWEIHLRPQLTKIIELGSLIRSIAVPTSTVEISLSTLHGGCLILK